jgi:steroid delta-isomerase-like uncharacterized protein
MTEGKQCPRCVATSSGGPAMTLDDWIQQYLDAWNSHDGASVSEFMAEDVTYEDLPLGITCEGRDAIKAFVEQTEQLSKDYKWTSVSEQASADRYAFEWEIAGTHTGEVAGLPATNKPYRIRGVSIGRLDGEGKIKANRDYWDLANFMMQVGILPSPAV